MPRLDGELCEVIRKLREGQKKNRFNGLVWPVLREVLPAEFQLGETFVAMAVSQNLV